MPMKTIPKPKTAPASSNGKTPKVVRLKPKAAKATAAQAHRTMKAEEWLLLVVTLDVTQRRAGAGKSQPPRIEQIERAEDREKFRNAMREIGLESPRSRIAHSMEEALAVQAEIGFPTVIRPSFTLGGTGGGIAYNREEFEEICARGLDLSPTNELLIDESLIGWKEYEMEVMRDKADNAVIICSIVTFSLT